MLAMDHGGSIHSQEHSQYTGAGMDTERVALAYMWHRWKVNVCRLQVNRRSASRTMHRRQGLCVLVELKPRLVLQHDVVRRPAR